MSFTPEELDAKQVYLQATVEVLGKTSSANLSLLWNEVAALFRSEQRFQSAKEASKFFVGQRVQFEGKKGATIYGTVERINQKSVTVKDCSDDSVGWRVAPSMLSALVVDA